MKLLDKNPEHSFAWLNNRRLLAFRYFHQPLKNPIYMAKSSCELTPLDFLLLARRSANRPDEQIDFAASNRLPFNGLL
jgi:hypothetical protein